MDCVTSSEVRVVVLGEIISAKGFNCPYHISVQFYLELPKGWRRDESADIQSPFGGATHSSSATTEGVVHFSHPFFNQLILSMDVVGEDSYPRPLLLFSVVGTDGKMLRDEGYAAESLPSAPGNYLFNLHTWKPVTRSISDKMKDLFLGISPSIQDPKTILTGSDSQETRRLNLFGLETEPSGTLRIRLRIIHQSEQGGGIQGEKLLLLEKMSSAGILKSVQAVIEAFQRARRQAAATKI